MEHNRMYKLLTWHKKLDIDEMLVSDFSFHDVNLPTTLVLRCAVVHAINFSANTREFPRWESLSLFGHIIRDYMISYFVYFDRLCDQRFSVTLIAGYANLNNLKIRITTWAFVTIESKTKCRAVGFLSSLAWLFWGWGWWIACWACAM